jgi:hypothetical protein
MSEYIVAQAIHIGNLSSRHPKGDISALILVLVLLILFILVVVALFLPEFAIDHRQ